VRSSTVDSVGAQNNDHMAARCPVLSRWYFSTIFRTYPHNTDKSIGKTEKRIINFPARRQVRRYDAMEVLYARARVETYTLWHQTRTPGNSIE
jgi:hypothetical protein